MDRLKSRAAEIELRINAELFGEARVIACTLVGSAHHLLEGMKFGTLFIDEAAQALEAACWIPMRRASILDEKTIQWYRLSDTMVPIGL